MIKKKRLNELKLKERKLLKIEIQQNFVIF